MWEVFDLAFSSPTTVNASAGMQSFLPYISEVTNFWFGRMVAIAIFVIFAMGYLRAKPDDYIGAFAVSSYVTFVLGLLFWVMGLLTGLDFALILGLTMISSVVLFLQPKSV